MNIYLYFNSSFEKNVSFKLCYVLIQTHFLKSFNASKGIHNSEIFMIYIKLGDTTDIA